MADSFDQGVQSMMQNEWGSSYQPDSFGTQSLFDSQNISALNQFSNGWTNKDKLGLGGLAIQGALGIGSYLGQNEMNKLALDQAKYDRVRQEKEDADYDAFKASWSNQFSNTAPANTATAPTSSTTVGTQVAPVSAFTG